MLKTQNLTLGYRGKEIVHAVSVKFPPGKITAILGVNGSGKSTLLLGAAGLLRPICGQTLLDEMPVGDYSRLLRAQKLSFLPQFRETPDMTVYQLALQGRFPYRKEHLDHEAEARAALEKTGLTALSDRPLALLSGGERQRAYLSLLLAQKTQTLLLDEPTAHLDMHARLGILKLLRELAQEGRAIGVVLHDLSLALEWADTLYVLESGRLLAHGTPDDPVLLKTLSASMHVPIISTQIEGRRRYIVG